MTIENCRSSYDLLDQQKIWEQKISPLVISEKTESGKGYIAFQINAPVVAIKPGQTPISWVSNRKCADGGFISFDDKGCHLHIVELKSNLAYGDWDHVKKQVSGFLMTALALKGIFKIEKYESVKIYVAFKDDSAIRRTPSSPALIKTAVGGGAPLSGAADYLTGKVHLFTGHRAVVVKIKRDVDGNGSLLL